MKSKARATAVFDNFVFLHGGGQGGWVWDETIAALREQAPDTHAMALDVPGCGIKRARDTVGLSFEAIVEDLAEDIRASGRRDVILVGHSQAGCVLPGLARLLPDRIKKLIYVSCSAPNPGLTVAQMMTDHVQASGQGAAAKAYRDPDMAAADRYRLLFCNDMVPAQATAFLAGLGSDNWPASSYAETGWCYDDLGDPPASYVLCLQDAILPLEWQRRFAERFRAERCVSVDAGHQVMNTRPQALAEILLAEAALAESRVLS